jgi:hypothetical protein
MSQPRAMASVQRREYFVFGMLLLLATTLGGCSAETSAETDGSADAQGDSGELDAPDTRPLDGGPDIDIVPGDVSADTDAVVTALSFALVAPRFAPAGSSIPFRVHALNTDGSVAAGASGGVNLETEPADALATRRVILRRGVGSLTTSWTGEPFRVRVDGTETWAEVAPFAGQPTTLNMPIDADAVWTANTWIRLDESLTLEEASRLRVESGVWVELGPSVNLFANGPIQVDGAIGAPVVFSGIGGDPWGGVVMGADGGEFTHTFFIEGGADGSRAFGHSNSQAVVFSDGGDVLLADCTIQDGPGKAMGARRGAWIILRSLITRTDTGGEFEHAGLLVEDTWFTDFPELDPAPRDDDNDAIYLLGDPGNPAQPLSTIRRSTFLGGADDGIDHNGSDVVVEQSWIEGFHNECVAASSGARIHVEDTVLLGCQQCLEAGYGAPTVTGNHLLVAGCDVGLRFGDNYDREYTGTLSVRNSVVFANAERDVWNWLFSTNAPAEGRVLIDNSLLSADQAEGGSGNVVGEPQLTVMLLLGPSSAGVGIADGGLEPGLLTGRPGQVPNR